MLSIRTSEKDKRSSFSFSLGVRTLENELQEVSVKPAVTIHIQKIEKKFACSLSFVFHCWSVYTLRHTTIPTFTKTLEMPFEKEEANIIWLLLSEFEQDKVENEWMKRQWRQARRTKTQWFEKEKEKNRKREVSFSYLLLSHHSFFIFFFFLFVFDYYDAASEYQVYIHLLRDFEDFSTPTFNLIDLFLLFLSFSLSSFKGFVVYSLLYRPLGLLPFYRLRVDKNGSWGKKKKKKKFFLFFFLT